MWQVDLLSCRGRGVRLCFRLESCEAMELDCKSEIELRVKGFVIASAGFILVRFRCKCPDV